MNHDQCNLSCTVDLTMYNRKSLGMRELRWRENCRNKLFPRSFPTKSCLQVVLLPKINFYKCKLPSCYHFSFHANTWSIYLLWPVSMVFFINWQLASYVISIFGSGRSRGRRCCDSGKWECRLSPQSFRFFLVIIYLRSFDHLSIDLKIWSNGRRMSVCHSRGKSHEDWYTWRLCVLGLSFLSYPGIYSWATSGTLHTAGIRGTLFLRIRV